MPSSGLEIEVTAGGGTDSVSIFASDHAQHSIDVDFGAESNEVLIYDTGTINDDYLMEYKDTEIRARQVQPGANPFENHVVSHNGAEHVIIQSTANLPRPNILDSTSGQQNSTFHSNLELIEHGDVNRDGSVDSTDLGLLLNNFGAVVDVAWAQGDLNFDGKVDSADLGLLLNNF